ncbi:hypothetical protein ACP4OV_012662 [Aristida adscensionis]
MDQLKQKLKKEWRSTGGWAGTASVGRPLGWAATSRWQWWRWPPHPPWRRRWSHSQCDGGSHGADRTPCNKVV